MKIYWRQKDIPALQGLSKAEVKAAKERVIYRVWTHWQVWVPFLAQVILFSGLLLFLPPFPYRAVVILAVIFFSTRVAALPFHAYLAHYLASPPESIDDAKRTRERVTTTVACVVIVLVTAVASWFVLSL